METVNYITSEEYTQIVILSMIRQMCKIKAVDVARALGITQSAISMLENGRIRATREHIKKYSDYLQSALVFKNDLLEVVTTLSKDHRITDADAVKNPVDFLYTFLKACCE